MKKLLLAVMLLCVSCAYAADFPRSADAVLDYLYAKLGNNVTRNTISTNNIDYKMCNLQYQACKDERSILRLLTRHISVADQLMESKVNGDSKRGFLIANSALYCANQYLKDKTLAAGIAISMMQPNIDLADDDFCSDKGKIYIANDILNAARGIDDDVSIIKAFDLMIRLTNQYPNTVDAYRIKYGYYQYINGRYVEALAQLDALIDPGMIAGAAKLRNNILSKINKGVN